MGRMIVRLVMAAAALCVAAYIAVVTVMTATQSAFFFHPDARPADLIAARLSGFRSETLITDDGERLEAWWRPPDPGRGVVLYLHGNGDNRAAPASRLRDVADTGAGVLILDYRGYGGSTGTPSEQGFYRDARAAWRFVRREAPQRPVVIWGESLGTGVATQLATEVDEAGLILDSPPSSLPHMAQVSTPWFPSILIRHRFDTAHKIGRVGSPVLIAHCEADRTVPFKEGQRVFAAAVQPKQFYALPGCAHVQIWREPAKSAILAFLKAHIGAAAP